jgi:hypothetical protein
MNAVAYHDAFNNFILFIVILNTCRSDDAHPPPPAGAAPCVCWRRSAEA